MPTLEHAARATSWFGGQGIDVHRASDGAILLGWSGAALRLTRGEAAQEAAPATQVPNVTDWLEVWAHARPDALFMAQRNARGAWEGVTYAQAWHSVKAIAWRLIKDYDAPWEPLPRLFIVSPNSVRQALLTIAALHVGVAVVPLGRDDVDRIGASGSAPQGVARRLVYVEGSAAALSGRVATVIDPDALDRWAAGSCNDQLVAAFHREAMGDRTAKAMISHGPDGATRLVAMSHAGLAAAQALDAALMGAELERAVSILAVCPWHDVAGGTTELHRVLRSGGTAYLEKRGTLVRDFSQWHDTQPMGPTHFMDTPAGLAALVSSLEQDHVAAHAFFRDLQRIELDASAAPLPTVARAQALCRKVAGREVSIVIRRAWAELVGRGFATPNDSPQACALGLPLPGVAAKLVPRGRVWELRVGEAGVEGFAYVGPEERARWQDQDGYYFTGETVDWLDRDDPAKGLKHVGLLRDSVT